MLYLHSSWISAPMLLDIFSALVLEPTAFPMMAATSGCFFYPIRGMFYFVKTPILWGNLLMMAVPQIVLTFVVFTLVYVFLYPPQAAIGLLFNGPVGLLGAWIGMAQEAAAFTQILSAILLMPTPLRIMFDAILTKEGHHRLVQSGKLRQKGEVSDHMVIMRFLKRLPMRLLFPIWFFKILVRLSLTFIPVCGPVILVVLDANGTSERCFQRWFDLKGFDEAECRSFIRKRRGQFFAFGLVAAALEALPFIGIVFMFTNTCGGALWAVDIEDKTGERPATNQSKLKLFFR